MAENIAYLIEGYKQFHDHYFDGGNNTFEQLVKDGQKPKVLVISCSDSRVDPSIILNTKPGDLFVVRNVANLVPPYEDDAGYHGTSAALEFAVCDLGIEHIIIFGHSMCGGIQSLINYEQKPIQKGFISKWMEIALNAKNITIEKFHNKNPAVLVDECSKYAIINSMNNLKTFPWIKSKFDSGNLIIHGWYFDLLTGTILEYCSAKENFKELGT